MNKKIIEKHLNEVAVMQENISRCGFGIYANYKLDEKNKVKSKLKKFYKKPEQK